MEILVTLLILGAIVVIACAAFTVAIRRHIRRNPNREHPHTERDFYDKW